MNDKSLIRPTNNKMVAGVFSGLTEYFDWDATLLRAAFVASFLMPGPQFPPHLAAWIIMPKETYVQARSTEKYLKAIPWRIYLMSDVAPEKSTKKIYRSCYNRLLGGTFIGITESQGRGITFTRMVYIILPCVGSMLDRKIGAGFLALCLLAWFAPPDDEYTLDDSARGPNPVGKENKQ